MPEDAQARLRQPSRRALLAAGGWLVVARPVGAAELPGAADSPALAAALARYAGAAPVREGRVQLELSELVENGNAVPVRVWVDNPMTPQDHVVSLALFTGRNPQPDVAVFHLGEQAGRAEVHTRMRLATSQTVLAAARLSDGSVWTRRTGVLVTLAACVEGD